MSMLMNMHFGIFQGHSIHSLHSARHLNPVPTTPSAFSVPWPHNSYQVPHLSFIDVHVVKHILICKSSLCPSFHVCFYQSTCSKQEWHLRVPPVSGIFFGYLPPPPKFFSPQVRRLSPSHSLVCVIICSLKISPFYYWFPLIPILHSHPSK